ncbi:Bug family tripartite tricarboxylate transporter substrate binding protein [Marinobacterium lutimaris]|uniref:Tripartite-type tricarboxylate transporter, receptor component TctC n=1 Tax=Marinobacterium lutimaris TaxID=568106 RepID=A0A1H6B491_9GAMM|nr:tripartite tricarboxylate transporter substrate binding protein [Marinobacterium lutimaris]SEG55422.1 Tripartite-type tricarboxylate transporter, receptor component TctC [Marinobacterium lutimaris]
MRPIKTTLKSCLIATTLVSTCAFAQGWTPEKPINIIVPWGAGGSTDQVTRITAPLLEKGLGQSIVVVNQPGASGAIGTRETLLAKKDGYTWTANAIANNANYSINGLIEGTDIDDWHIYLSVANVPVVSVPSSSEFNDFGELLAAFKERGENITVATAGGVSSGGTAISSISDAGGFKYRMITYPGGNPAVIAAARGEAMVTTQLAVSQAEMIRGGRLKPLAVLSDQPLMIEGTDPIPPITNWLPDFPIAPDYFGVFIPKDAPQEVIAAMDKVWEEQVMHSPELEKYARHQGAIFDPSYGDEARRRAMPSVIENACAYVARGEAVIDPKEIGIDCEKHAEVSN